MEATMEKSSSEKEGKVEIESGCFVCHGTGHWARECTSLPSIYLTDDAPKCYRCGGIGHFARFCPTSEKQYRHRERRASLPSIAFPPSDWSPFYFNDLLIPTMTPDQVFLVRPEYIPSASPTSAVENIEDDEGVMSDCSSVEYIIEPEGLIHDNEHMVEISIETKN